MALLRSLWRHRLAIGGAISVFLAIAGLGGFPDALAQWQDWLGWLSGDFGQWVFVIAGVTLFFFTFSNRIEIAMPVIGAKDAAIPVSVMERTFLHYREHCGASWRPRITQDSTVILGPFCPEDHAELKFRRPLSEYETQARQRKREEEERQKERQERQQKESATRGLISSFALPPIRPLLSLGDSEEEYDTYHLRPLNGADKTKDENTGPFCKECGRFRRMDKTVDECRLDVLQDVKKDFGLP